MDIKKCLTAVVVFFMPAVGVQATEPESYKIPRTEVISIQDTQSNKQYELLIKLPESYAQNKDKNYPVIYFTDAVWHIELLSSITSFMMEDVILVGISWQKDIAEDTREQYGDHFSRYGDYSFKKTTNPNHPKIKFGQAESHIAFIRKDVIRFVEKSYRTEPNNRTYFGFSAGGAFGAYALIAYPDTFNHYILGSPSIWENAPALFAQENIALKRDESEINVFISYGELEKELSQHVEDFVSQLKDEKYKGLSSIKRTVIDSAGHSDSSPMMSVQSIKWLAEVQSKGDE